MASENKIELEVEVNAQGLTEEELDQSTRNLLNELKGSDVVSATLALAGTAPQGSKGDPVTAGTLALEVLPVAVPSLIALVQAWVMRKQGRTVKFKAKGFEFEGSPEEFELFLATFQKENKKK